MKKRILIVEDNQIERKILVNILNEEYDILEAENGKVAISTFCRNYKTISAVLLDIMLPITDGYEFLKIIRANNFYSQIPIIVITGLVDDNTQTKALSLGANAFITKPYNPDLLKIIIRNSISLCETAISAQSLTRDPLTGLYNQETFFAEIEKQIKKKNPGYYSIACSNVEHFKYITDHFGTEKGNAVLKHIAGCINECATHIGGLCCRVADDKFAILYPTSFTNSSFVLNFHKKVVKPDAISQPIRIRIGRYVINDLSISANVMYDRAAIAEESIKGRYDVYIADYQDSMFDRLFYEQQLILDLTAGLKSKQFEVWYQPQYNHADGSQIGAEALVRWRHPTRGLISPGIFIPLLEKNGLIYQLDCYVWEEVASQLRKWLNLGKKPLPVSVNVSRHDIFQSDFYSFITSLVDKYRLPHDLLRLEVTESAFVESYEQIIAIIEQLRMFGFYIEIDDFGSGYSSLNILKDVPANILKLDIRFFDGKGRSMRGGRIIESVLRMAKWLDMVVIAEGIETKEQADYLLSLGCKYIQGFLYAKPMPIDEYEAITDNRKTSKMEALYENVFLGGDAFWNPDSLETMVFNHFSGGAFILEYWQGYLEILRINSEFAKTLKTDLTEEEILRLDPFANVSHPEHQTIIDMLNNAIQSGTPEMCEIYTSQYAKDGEGEYIKLFVRLIASNADRYLFYGYVENVTNQRLNEIKKQIAEEETYAVNLRLEAVMQNMNGGVTVAVIRDGIPDILYANNQFYEMLGFTKEEYEKKVANPHDLLYPDDHDEIVAETEMFSRLQKSSTTSYRVVRADNTIRWWQSNISTVRLPGNDEPVQVTVSSDITEKHISHEQLRFLNRISAQLLSHPNIENGIGETISELLRYYKGDRVYVFEKNNDSTLSNTYECCAPNIATEKANLQNIAPEKAPLWQKFLNNQKYLIINRVDDLPANYVGKALLQSQNVQSLIAVPLKSSSEVFGFIGIDNPRRQTETMNLLAIVGDYISVLLSRLVLSKRVSNEEQTILSIMEGIPGGFGRMKVLENGRMIPVYLSNGLLEMLGMNYDDFLQVQNEAKLTDEIVGVHPDDSAQLKDTFYALLEKGEIQSNRFRLRCKNGDYKTVMFYGKVWHNDLGETFLNIYYMNTQ